MSRILLTGFDPFAGENINPALEAVRLIPECINDVIIRKITVPTVFEKSILIVREAIRAINPSAVVCVGQAGGRAEITVERVAINIDDATIPDNEREQPVDQVIVAGGPPAYFSTLPIKAIMQAIHEKGIPASISNSAGTFVCNHLLYGVLDILANEFPSTIGGFIHVPFIPTQAMVKSPIPPSMPLEDIVRGLEIALTTIIRYMQKLK